MLQKRAKRLALVLAAAMVFSTLPVTAQAASATVGPFLVTGNMAGFGYSNGVLTFTIPDCYTVAMANEGTTAQADRIAVNATGSVELTLTSVRINVSGTSGACAFDIQGSSAVQLNLQGSSVLTSGQSQPGLHLSPDAALTIDGHGTLRATGGLDGAGIGGGYRGDSGSITINGGEVCAAGGYFGAGIGGGDQGKGGAVTINGGTVNANGGDDSGAGIGGGFCGTNDTITINSGTVTAKGGASAAGIGGGSCGDGGPVNINGGVVTATSTIGAGIGGGQARSAARSPSAAARLPHKALLAQGSAAESLAAAE